MKLFIPEPCHENWNNMTPKEQGRFCASCQKTVVDFTSWSAEDIQRYFAKHYYTKTCGRFKTKQLNQPLEIVISRNDLHQMPRHLYFLAALFIVFGTTLFSCTDFSGNQRVVGEITVVNPTPDSPVKEHTLVGGVSTEEMPPSLEGLPPVIIDPMPNTAEIMGEPQVRHPNENELIFGMMQIVPEFPGGLDSIRSYIRANLVYPAVQDTLEGKVMVRFKVSAEGDIKDVEVLKSLSPAYDEAAVNVIRKMPKWKNPEAVETTMTFPIIFTK